MAKKKSAKKNKSFQFTLFANHKIVLLGIVLVTLSAVIFFFTLPNPAKLKTENPTLTSFMKYRIDEARKKGENLKLQIQWTAYGRIPLLLKQCIRIAEDDRFFNHQGIDYQELEKTIKDNLRKGKTVRGGSTITQQLAKNLYLSPKKSLWRKFREFFIAKRMEKALSKDRIFEIYLNCIEFGKGIFGLGAASRYFFKKPPWQLDLQEILRLTAVIPKPLRVSPLSNSRYMFYRAKYLLKRLRSYGYISSDQYIHTLSLFKH
jgi:monofunctional biosynthetic peptidoglycan transglycosylase